MQVQGDSPKKQMYILSLDNGRIAWILAIALLVLVFLFLLGYWIGHDTTDNSWDARLGKGDKRTNRELALLKKELDGDPLARDPDRIRMLDDSDGNPKKKELFQRGGDKETARSSGKQESRENMRNKLKSPREVKEFESLQGKKARATRKTVRKVARKRPSRAQRKVRKTSPSRRRVSKPAPKRQVATSSGKYAIQVASLRTRSTAERVQRRLSSRSYNAYVVPATVDGKTYYRIKVGKFRNMDRARSALDKLRGSQLGKNSYIVTD